MYKFFFLFVNLLARFIVKLLQELLYSCRYISKMTHWYYKKIFLWILAKNVGRKKTNNYIFIFAKKKKQDQKNENLWKKLFSGRKFLLAVCPAYSRCHVFYPSYFILFYFMLFYFNLAKECIYLNKIPLFYTLLVGWGPKVDRSTLQCDFVLPHTFKISR